MDASIPIAAAMIAGPLFLFIGYLLGRIPRREREPPDDWRAFEERQILEFHARQTIEDRARKQQ
jgi:hypothetical protein